MKLKKKLIVIACITLVIIASVDAAENDASEKKAAKKKKKSKKVKNVQADDAQVQNQQPNYPEYPDNYDYNDNDYEEPENGGPGKRICHFLFSHSRDFVAEFEKSVENVELFGFLSLYALISCIFPQ